MRRFEKILSALFIGIVIVSYQNCQQKVNFDKQEQSTENSTGVTPQSDPTPTEVNEFKAREFW